MLSLHYILLASLGKPELQDYPGWFLGAFM